MLRPHTSLSTLGVWFFIRVPSPAARMITAAGPLTLTRLGSSVSAQARPVAHRRGIPPGQFTLPTLAGYRPAPSPGPACADLGTSGRRRLGSRNLPPNRGGLNAACPSTPAQAAAQGPA